MFKSIDSSGAYRNYGVTVIPGVPMVTSAQVEDYTCLQPDAVSDVEDPIVDAPVAEPLPAFAMSAV